jgi:hypothetical protein
MIKVKRITTINEKVVVPVNYVPINVMSWNKTNEFYQFSPYHLRTDGDEKQLNNGNIIFENFWQGSKVFDEICSIDVYPNWRQRNNPKQLIWHYTATNNCEKHYDKETKTISAKYFEWRNSIWNCQKAIRYPNGYNKRSKVLFSLYISLNNVEHLDYIQSRKMIYFNEYCRLIRKLPIYNKLLGRLKNNENLCILEIDVPTKGKKGLYGKNVNDDNTYDCTLERINALLEDPSEPFGHGLCIVHCLLMDKEK